MAEIERRYLCTFDPDAIGRFDAVHRIAQGYLVTGPVQIRIRRLDDLYVLGAKAGAGLVRQEAEVEVSPDVGAHLLEQAGEVRVEKVRYVIDGWEVDLFEGKLVGLQVAEFELDEEHLEVGVAPPGLVLGREITHELELTSSALARLSPAAARVLVERLLGLVPDSA